jgi:hypothetical protein
LDERFLTQRRSGATEAAKNVAWSPAGFAPLREKNSF